MTISLLTSVPGGGKTSYAVWSEILKEVARGRVVYTCGIPKLKIDNIQLSIAQVRKWSERREIPPDPNDHDLTARHELLNIKEGSLIVIDEAYKVWPVVGKAVVSDDVEHLREHRHYGLDIFLLSQRPNFIDSTVLGLVERHMHITPEWFGRRIYEWTEYRSNPTTKSIKAEAVKRPYKVPKESWDLYHSASVHIKPKKAIPRQLFFVGAVLLAAPFAVWALSQNLVAKFAPSAAVVDHGDVKPLVASVAAPVPSSVPVPVAPAPEPAKPVLTPIQLVSASIDWKQVTACLQSENNGCVCYGKSAERLVVPKESCELAVKHGWPGV